MKEKVIKKISYYDTKPFLLNVHYARRMPCIQYAFGLFVDEKLIGVVTFWQPASAPLCKGLAGEKNRKNVLELNRLAILPEYNGKNYASFLVGNALNMLPRKTFVVSYADSGWGHIGYVYQATNFIYTGMTKARTDKYSESGHARHYKAGETRRQYRTAKYRYVFLVGTKRDKKQMLKELNYPIIAEYPKGDSFQYDINDPKPIINLKEVI